MRTICPYGKWSSADWREVSLNRDYCPIWEKLPNGDVVQIEPDAYVKYETSEHYYNCRTLFLNK